MSKVVWFEDVTSGDVDMVGGKNASLGEMINEVDVPVPPGFATTSEAYDVFIEDAGIKEEVREILESRELNNVNGLREAGSKVRKLIRSAEMPEDLKEEVRKKYGELGDRLGEKDPLVAVRSSATAEDLPTSSFAGQMETYLNVSGEAELFEAVKKCMASLFTDRAIHYREDKGFDHFKVKLSVGVQEMVRSESAGVAFTIDPDSGFENVVYINGNWGLGETVVGGEVNPDEYMVFKPTKKLISRELGDKEEMELRENGENVRKETPDEMRGKFVLANEEAEELAEYATRIHEYYGKPMDIEWAKDRRDGNLYILQARPETVQSQRERNVIRSYHLKEESEELCRGQAIGREIGSGRANVIMDAENIDQFEEGQVLVTDMTDPDWEPIMKIASAIVTDKGGSTCFTGDTKILTSEGFLSMKEGYEMVKEGKNLQILSYNYESKKPEWKDIRSASVRERKAMKFSCSQTGRARGNSIGLTPDHKMYTYEKRKLIKRRMDKILEENGYVCLIDRLPKSSLKIPKLAYLAGAILSDGYLRSNKRRGQVVFTQKDSEKRRNFIKTVKDYFEDLFDYGLKGKVKVSTSKLRGRQITGTAVDYVCSKRDVADLFIKIKENLNRWVLSLDRESSIKFLAGLLDGDGSINNNRLNLYVGKNRILQGVVIACLKLGIVPQVTSNRKIWNVQIVEKQNEVLKECKRLKGETWEKGLATKLFSAKQLLEDAVEGVNHEGKVKPYVKKNLLIGDKVIRKRVLPLADKKLKSELKEVLGSDLRMYRVREEEDLGVQKVYNFEVDEDEELEKNYIVFTSRYTPLLVSNSHAAIVSRELGIPAVVGTGNASSVLKTGQPVTVDCTTGEGRIMNHELDFEVMEEEVEKIPETETEVMMNVSVPGKAFDLGQYPVQGVGLARQEFIIGSHIGEHPLKMADEERGGEFVEKLSYGIAKIAAGFYPKPVIVRLSDFKTNEYAGLEGGKEYEPEEENPMLGWRGAFRYTSPDFREAFELECQALKRVRDEMGLTNVKIMIPFCRTPEEARETIKILEENGLEREKNGLEIYIMAEIPSNIILAEEFAELVDGFSIGSNDLTQLTLGVDRDSQKLQEIFDERDEAVKKSIRNLIERAHKHGTKTGICGDAPSSKREYAKFLVECGIDSISVTPDVALKTIMKVAEVESKL